MKGFFPSWWKWGLAGLLAVLAGVFVWQDAKHDQVVIVDPQESPKPFSPSRATKSSNRLVGHTEASEPDKIALGLSAMEEMRQKLAKEKEFTQQLQKESAVDLLARLRALWDAGGVKSRGPEEKALVTMALTQALHSVGEDSNAAVYQQMSALLRNEALPLSAKQEIALILGSAQTPHSVQFLLEEYKYATSDKVRESLGNGIGRTGNNLWAGPFHEDLSPALEAAWPLAKNDPRLAEAAAIGLAKVGTAAGVQLLINEVLRAAQTVEGLYDLKDAQGQAAFFALVKVRNPNAIEVLSTGLLNANSSEVNQYVCGMSLAAMGRGEATQVLLQWALTATDREAAWAEQWFGKLRDTASFELVAAALSPTNAVAFNSATIRNAVVFGQRNRE